MTTTLTPDELAGRLPVTPERVAALFVRPDGPYASMPGVDAWDEARDARTYVGPWPVVVHPPCKRWGRLWWTARHKGEGKGEDAGCFAAAVAAVRRWGGVLEHPAESFAWARFGLPVPPARGWGRGLIDGGWSCQVHQRNYGHRAQKLTWLYYVGDAPPFALDWTVPDGSDATPVEHMGHAERELTPRPLACVLVDLARRSARSEAA